MTENTGLFLLFMLPATFLLGIYDVLGKRLAERKAPRSALVAVIFLSSGLAVLPAAIWQGVPDFQEGLWPAFVVCACLNLAANFLWYWALSLEDASLLAPIRLLTAPLVILTGYAVLGEVPSVWGTVGVLTSFAGFLLLVGTDEKKSGSNGDGSSFLRPGILMAVACAVSGAVTFSFDKQAVQCSSAVFFTASLLLSIGAGALLVFILEQLISRRSLVQTVETLYAERRIILLLALVHGVAALLSFAALPHSMAAYAASTKRLWSFWSVILAGQFLGEGGIRRKLICVAIMLVGIALPYLF